MVATLKKSGTSFTLANEKRFEAWGTVRYDAGVPGSDHVVNPKTRYCANLGHWDDNVTGLTYMRARWYDASTGRFISEDPARQGWNWLVYCNQNPIEFADNSGKFPLAVVGLFFLLGFIAAACADFMAQYTSKGSVDWGEVLGWGIAGGLVSAGFGAAGVVAGSAQLSAALTGYATGSSAASIGLQCLVATAGGSLAGMLATFFTSLVKIIVGSFGRQVQVLMLLDAMQYE